MLGRLLLPEEGNADVVVDTVLAFNRVGLQLKVVRGAEKMPERSLWWVFAGNDVDGSVRYSSEI